MQTGPEQEREKKKKERKIHFRKNERKHQELPWHGKIGKELRAFLPESDASETPGSAIYVTKGLGPTPTAVQRERGGGIDGFASAVPRAISQSSVPPGVEGRRRAITDSPCPKPDSWATLYTLSTRN